jgi:hypothetical protein
MPLTAEDQERFLSSLRTDEAFREELRRELLTTELRPSPSASLASSTRCTRSWRLPTAASTRSSGTRAS